MEREFNYCLTLIGSISMNENDVRAILELEPDAILTEKDWTAAIKEHLNCTVGGLDLDDFNDIEIEEVLK